MKKCLVCMHDYSEEQERCPACGYSERQLRLDSEKFTEALEPGSGLMGGRFIIGRILSYSNFSILYLSWDTLMSRRVVIREYFPCGICKREGKSPSIVSAKGKERIAFMNGRKMFETENSCLNQNQDLPEIVNIYFPGSNKTSVVIMDENDQLAAFAICFPSISKALQKAKGHLFPFGWWHLLRALKNYEDIDLMLNGATPKWQNTGVSGIYHMGMLDRCNANGSIWTVTNPQIETNSAANAWGKYDHELFMRRRCYLKKIDK